MEGNGTHEDHLTLVRRRPVEVCAGLRRHSNRAVGAAAVAAAVALSLAACGSSKPGNSGGDSGKSASLTVVWNSTPDVTYLPMLMAVHQMKKQGYNINAQTVSGADVAAQALASNRAQFTADNITGAAAAVAHGAGIKIVAVQSANEAAWVTAPGYEDCNKLTGKSVGIFGPAAASGYTKEMDLYFKRHCPNVKPHLVTIPDSSLRAQAMANHQIVATVLAISDAGTLTKKLDPSGHYNVTPMSKEFPGLADNYIYANSSVLKNDPAAVTAFVADTLKATRQIYADANNTAAFSKLLSTYLSAKSYTAESAKSTLDAKIWYANGGLDQQGTKGLAETLKVFQLPGTAKSLIDNAPMQAALKQVGTSQLTQR